MAKPLTDKELAEFRRQVDGLHDMSLGTSMRVGAQRRLLATIDASRDQLQQARQQLVDAQDARDNWKGTADDNLDMAGRWRRRHDKAREKLAVLEEWREAKHTCPVDYCCWGAALTELDRIFHSGGE